MPFSREGEVTSGCPGLGDWVKGGKIVGVRGVLVLPTTASIEDPSHSGSTQPQSWRGKQANFSPLSLGAIFHHLCIGVYKLETLQLYISCNTLPKLPLCWKGSYHHTLLPSQSTSANIKQIQHKSKPNLPTLVAPMSYAPQAC